MTDCCDFIVYADESDDHGLVAIDPQYPVFAPVFRVMRKCGYTANVRGRHIGDALGDEWFSTTPEELRSLVEAELARP